MGRTKQARILEVVEEVVDTQELFDIAAVEADERKPHSVVKVGYKVKYKERAMAAGLKGKAAKRSNGDWLAVQMRELVLTKKEKLDLDKLEALCEANELPGIGERWPNRNKGWEGRLRMTACLVLRKIVADNQALRVPGEADRIPPHEFVVKNETR